MKHFSDLIEKTVTEKEEKKVQKPPDISKRKFRITKSDDDRMLAFGWASVSMRVDGELIEDWQKDIVEPEELEHAAYEYVLLSMDLTLHNNLLFITDFMRSFA